MKVREIFGRGDYALISELIPAGARVLDLGCGDGALLHWLKENKAVEARGIERRSESVQQAIARGVTVYQGTLEDCLPDYPDQTFDYVILSQTLQETRDPLPVLNEMMRVGRHAVVAFPNFGHWRVRWSHLVSGRSPRTRLFPYDWYNSPNIHFLTVEDFEDLIACERWTAEARLFLAGHSRITTLPNLLAEVAVYALRR
jgi:methionine biosynthesis protein MetW